MVDTLVALAQSEIILNLGVLGVFIGLGLLKLRSGWRTCALFFVWLTFILIPFFCLVLFASGTPAALGFFGIWISTLPNSLALLVALFYFSVALWVYSVLTRPQVRQLFDVGA